MEVEERGGKRNYGRMGCFIALLVLIIVVILWATGLMNYPGEN